jgi:hypothetical protein
VIWWSFSLCRSLVAFVFDRVILRCPRGRRVGHKRRCTRRPEATSGCMPIRACCQSVECRQNPHSSDAHSPKQMTAVSTACRPHRQSPNAEERSTLLTTLLGMHTMARRHCEAARRQQARVTAGGPSFDRTRAGAEKFGPNQPPHRLHAPARSPQAQGGARRGPRWRSSFRCRCAVCHLTLSTICEKCEGVACPDSNLRLGC